MSNILSHQGNVNQDNSEIPFYNHQKCLRSKTQITDYAGEDGEQREHSSIAGGSTNLYRHFGYQYGGFSEI